MDLHEDIKVNSKEYLPTKFCIQAFMVIIQEALNQLCIMRKINNWPESIQKIDDFMYKTIKERHSEADVEPKNINEDSAIHQHTPRVVFEKKCTVAESVLTFLQEELATCGSYEQFSVIVDSFIKMENDDEELLKESLRKENELKTLEDTYENEKIDLCAKIENCMSETGKMKDRIEKIDDFMYKTIKERHSEADVEPKNINEDSAIHRHTPRVVFEKKCTVAESVLTFLQEELATCGSYEQFSVIVDSFIKMENDDEEVLKESLRKENELKTLEDTYENEKIDLCAKIENCMSETRKMNDRIEDFIIEEKVKENYVRAWLNSKREIGEILCQMNENRKIEEIKVINLNYGREIRVHEEISSAYLEFQSDLNETLQAWKERYTADLEKLLEKIRVLKVDYDEKLTKIMELQTLYSKREKEMNDYKQYKIEQEKIKIEKERQNNAATKIQAWWKGTMVRKGFGKFRKKKEKKGKKKSSEKKSGKTMK